MHVLSILFLGIATNLDNLFIGMLMGVRRRSISPLANAFIAALAFVLAGLCALLGHAGAQLGHWPNLLGGILLMGLGVYTIIPDYVKPWKKGEETPPTSIERDGSDCRAMGFKEIFGLAVVLASNSLAAAFGAGMTGIHPALVGLSIAGFSYLSVALGNLIGQKPDIRLKPDALNALSGAAMFIVGLWEIMVRAKSFKSQN